MSVSPQDLASFASELGDSEIQRRNACSRYYYACYHLAKDKANDPIPPLANAGMHESLSSYYERKNIKVSYTLTALKKIRTIADYKLEDEFPPHFQRQARDGWQKIKDELEKPCLMRG